MNILDSIGHFFQGATNKVEQTASSYEQKFANYLNQVKQQKQVNMTSGQGNILEQAVHPAFAALIAAPSQAAKVAQQFKQFQAQQPAINNAPKPKSNYDMLSEAFQTHLSGVEQFLGQGIQNVQTAYKTNPQQFNFINQLQAGKLDTGIKPLDKTAKLAASGLTTANDLIMGTKEEAAAYQVATQKMYKNQPLTDKEKKIVGDHMVAVGFGASGLEARTANAIETKLAPKIEAKVAPIIEEKIAPAFEAGGNKMLNWLKSRFTPIAVQSPDIQMASREWDTANKVSRVEANQVNDSFKQMVQKLGINPQDEWKLVKYSQTPSPATATKLGLSPELIQRAKPLLDASQQFNDQLYTISRSKGIDVGYLNHHLLQLWNEHPAQIEGILRARGLSSVPGFAKGRIVPSYQAAEDAGLALTPRFTSFGQNNGAAVDMLKRSLANREYADSLLKSGQLLPSTKAPADYQEITAKFFPKAKLPTADGVQEVSYSAPPKLAEFVNNLFGGQQRQMASSVVKGTGGFSSAVQDVALSSPGGAANAFSITHLVKDVTAGIGDLVTLKPGRSLGVSKASIQSILRPFVPGMSQNFERIHAQSILELARGGIGYQGAYGYERGKNVVATTGISTKVHNLWDALINEPTFLKFLQQRRVQIYEAFKTSLIHGGMSEDHAIQTAIEQLKTYDGITNSLGRSEDLENLLKTFILAPRYREMVVGSLANVVKSLLHPTDPAYSVSRSLLLGMIVTLFSYDQMNQHLNNGKHLWENPEGHKLDLVIPRKDDPKKYYAIPWMPGYTALPRHGYGAASALAHGDTKTTAKELGSFSSIPLQTGTELASGKDYFGRPIFPDGNPTPVDVAGYVASKGLPGTVRTGINYEQQQAKYEKDFALYKAKIAQGKHPTAPTPPSGMVALAQAFEMPLKQGTFLDPQSQTYFNAKAKLDSNLTQDQKKIATYLTMPQDKGGADSTAKASLLLKNPDLLTYYTQLQLASNPSNPLYTRSQNDIKLYLSYQLTDNTETKAKIRIAAPWLPQVQYEMAQQLSQTAYGKENNIMANQTPMQKLTPEAVKIVSAYTALPKGSMERRQLLAQNPWLKQYWDTQAAYYQQNPIQDTSTLGTFLASQGISTSPTQSGYQPGQKKIRLASVGRGKKITVKKMKPFKFKASKKIKPMKVQLLPKSRYATKIA